MKTERLKKRLRRILTLRLAGGGEVALPDDLTTPYGVVLFYRGHR